MIRSQLNEGEKAVAKKQVLNQSEVAKLEKLIKKAKEEVAQWEEALGRRWEDRELSAEALAKNLAGEIEQVNEQIYYKQNDIEQLGGHLLSVDRRRLY
jgi:hypothetical protein